MNDTTTDTAPLAGKVALVAGATRGAGRGIAVALGAAGATVYGTGRTTRTEPSEYDRAETIEETAELVDAAAKESGSGGRGIAVQVDHLEPDQVEALVGRIESEEGRLDILVNDIWGGENLTQWHAPIWEHDLAKGLRTMRLAVETHLVTSHFALKLLTKNAGGLVVEVTDGTFDYNVVNYRLTTFYDLAKWSPIRMAFALGEELAKVGSTAVCLTPGWLRSEMMLEHYGVTEETWREATERPWDGEGFHPGHFGISETPTYGGRAVVALAADPEVARWNRQSLSSGQLAREYGFTDVDGSQPDAWRYLVEVQDAGLPPNPSAYR